MPIVHPSSAGGGLPKLTVLLDDGSGTFPSDASAWVRMVDGLSISRGRENEQASINPSQLTITFDNTDGRFTLGAIGFQIKIDQKIRVLESVDGGTPVARFTGYVEQWPTQWPDGSGQFAVAQVTAFDEQARQARRQMVSVVEETILATPNLAAYWPLDDPDGSTAAKNEVVTTGGAQPLVTRIDKATSVFSKTPVVFGQPGPPGGVSATAAMSGGGYYLHADAIAGAQSVPDWVAMEFAFYVAPGYVNVGAADLCTVETNFIYPPSGELATFTLEFAFASGPPPVVEINLILTTPSTFLGIISQDVQITQGAWHTAGAAYGHPGISYYVDGVAYPQAGTLGATYVLAPARVELGANVSASLAHASFYTGMGSLPATSQWSDHATAILNGYANETGDARISRLAGYAKTPLGTLDAGQNATPGADLADKNVADVIQQVATGGEVGTAFIDGTGKQTFHNRNRTTLATTPALTLDVDSGIVNPDVQVLVDKADLVNYATTQAEGSSVVNVVQSTAAAASEVTHGRYPQSYTWLVTTDVQAITRAASIQYQHAEPAPRFPNLTLDLLTAPTSVQQAVLNLELDSHIRITGLPSQSPAGSSVDLLVDGWTETLTKDSWTLQINATKWSAGFILDDATYGVIAATSSPYPIGV